MVLWVIYWLIRRAGPSVVVKAPLWSVLGALLGVVLWEVMETPRVALQPLRWVALWVVLCRPKDERVPLGAGSGVSADTARYVTMEWG